MGQVLMCIVTTRLDSARMTHGLFSLSMSQDKPMTQLLTKTETLTTRCFLFAKLDSLIARYLDTNPALRAAASCCPVREILNCLPSWPSSSTWHLSSTVSLSRYFGWPYPVSDLLFLVCTSPCPACPYDPLVRVCLMDIFTVISSPSTLLKRIPLIGFSICETCPYAPL